MRINFEVLRCTESNNSAFKVGELYSCIGYNNGLQVAFPNGEDFGIMIFHNYGNEIKDYETQGITLEVVNIEKELKNGKAYKSLLEKRLNRVKQAQEQSKRPYVGKGRTRK